MRIRNRSHPTEGGGDQQVTCVDRSAFGIVDLENQDECIFQPMSDLYFQAVCAATFGGTPSDYREQDDWKFDVSEYPTSSYDPTAYCDVSADYESIDEIPSVEPQNLIPFNLTPYDRCSPTSYCETLGEIITAFPGAAEEDPFHCNLNPSGDANKPGPWVCIGSATDACGEAAIPESFAYPDPIRWCPVIGDAHTPYCVLSTSAMASADCESLCVFDSAKNDYILGATDYPPATHFDCDVFDAPAIMIWASDIASECRNQQPIVPSLTLSPFSFSASLTTDGGHSASLGPNGTFGLIDFAVDNCSGGYCDILVSDIFTPSLEYNGTIYDALSTPDPYVLAGVSLTLMSPVQGIVTQNVSAPWAVEFPSGSFEVLLSADSISVDGTGFPFSPAMMNITDVTGTYSSGVLSLDIGYETIDATMLVTLTSS